ncbi:hypothetical protein niasHS_012198 [Heterodera schachtii]|uniref:Uncharacterized protein n=1 Tax=Heterodera schachtii TaxID=97005 RepID=A0ABD2IHL7_HETSC
MPNPSQKCHRRRRPPPVAPLRPPTRIVIIPPSSSSSSSSFSSSSSSSSSSVSTVSTGVSSRVSRLLFVEEEKDDKEQKEEMKPLLEECQKSEENERNRPTRRFSPPPLSEQCANKSNSWPNSRKRKSIGGWLPIWGRRKRIGTIATETKCQRDEAERRKKQFVYTNSRKANKEARMEQGPREYESCKEIGIDFCARTTSHGIPFVGAHSFFGRPFWTCVTTIAFCSFIIQTYFTLSDYLEYRTIIEMQLKFEPAPFPAATICNLNAFKLSEVRKFEEIEQGIKLWEKAISTLSRLKETPLRRRRQVHYRPIYVRCVCAASDDQCVPQRNELDRTAAVCLCYEDEETGDIWPCYLYSLWKEKAIFKSLIG